MTSNITNTQREIFEALRSGMYSNFALVSTELDGVPTTAIAALVPASDGYVGVAPLAVFIADSPLFNRLTPPDQEQAAADVAATQDAGRNPYALLDALLGGDDRQADESTNIHDKVKDDFDAVVRHFGDD